MLRFAVRFTETDPFPDSTSTSGLHIFPAEDAQLAAVSIESEDGTADKIGCIREREACNRLKQSRPNRY